MLQRMYCKRSQDDNDQGSTRRGTAVRNTKQRKACVLQRSRHDNSIVQIFCNRTRYNAELPVLRCSRYDNCCKHREHAQIIYVVPMGLVLNFAAVGATVGSTPQTGLRNPVEICRGGVGGGDPLRPTLISSTGSHTCDRVA